MTCLHSSRLVTRRLRRASDERGIALVVALLVMCLLTALGMALMLTSQTETMISANYRDSMEGAVRRRRRRSSASWTTC